MATVNLQCDKCESTNIVVPDDATESDWITCGDCGENLATVGQLNAEIVRQAKALAPKGVRDALKGTKGFKPR